MSMPPPPDTPDEDDPFGAEDLSRTEEDARKVLPALVDHVLQQGDDVLRPLTYLDLAARIGRSNKNGDPWARGLGHVLGRVTNKLDDIQPLWAEKIPYLTTIVVNTRDPNKGLPGDGVRHRWLGYGNLTRPDREAKVLEEYGQILSFGSRWERVLQQLGMAEAPSVQPGGDGQPDRLAGGESPQHKALKRFVFDHPELVGVGLDCRAEEERALRSGDTIDVFFESPSRWLGVEVKSSISDGLPCDYERGIYQVVKYREVLKAQAQADNVAGLASIDALLVLESQMPEKYRKVAKTLGVRYIEDVGRMMSHP
jgi:hypothetical protein